MDAKGRTSVKDRAAVRLAITVAVPKTLAKARVVVLPTAASRAFSHLHNLYPPGSPGGVEIKKGSGDLGKRPIPYCLDPLMLFMKLNSQPFETFVGEERICLQTPLTDILTMA